MLPGRISFHAPRFFRNRHTGSRHKKAMKKRSALMENAPRYSPQTLCAVNAAPQIIAVRSGSAVCLRVRFMRILYASFNFSSAAIFTHRQKICIACFSSSTGGSEGAMRMLLSCGSRP